MADKDWNWIAKETIRLAPKGSKWRTGKWGNKAGPLSMEIDVAKGKYSTGDYQIQAQGRGNYTKFYAIFVELGSQIVPYANVPRGTPDPRKIKIPKRPYLRPALKKNKRKIKQMIQAALDR